MSAVKNKEGSSPRTDSLAILEPVKSYHCRANGGKLIHGHGMFNCYQLQNRQSIQFRYKSLLFVEFLLKTDKPGTSHRSTRRPVI